MVTAKLHDQEFREALRKAVDAMAKSTRASLRLEGNLLGRELAARVKPLGFPGAGAVAQKATIAKEIDKLYYGRDDVFNSIRHAGGIMMARGWYRELMGGGVKAGRRAKRRTLTAAAAERRSGDVLAAQALARRWGGPEMAAIEFAPFDRSLRSRRLPLRLARLACGWSARGFHAAGVWCCHCGRWCLPMPGLVLPMLSLGSAW